MTELTFEFAHVGINAQSEEELTRLKDFFSLVLGYENYRELPISFFTGDNKIELMKMNGRGTMGHLGFFVNDMPKAIEQLEAKGYTLDYENARYDDKKNIELIYIQEEMNGFSIHLAVKKAPFYVEDEGRGLPVID